MRAASGALTQKTLRKLAEWFNDHQRPLPWRKSQVDPYEIWICEVMSQQSTMPTVLPYFERWMKNFPDRARLAQASPEEVQGLWAGLGYYSRGRNVLKAAVEMERLSKLSGQKWPSGWKEWIELPGIGPYTAKAISAIAFRDCVLPVDGNVIRVLSRVFGISNPLNSAADRQKLDEKVFELESLITADIAHELAQGFMELGSQVCRPGALAQCTVCPLAESCWTRLNDKVSEIPQKKATSKPIKETLRAHLKRQGSKGPLLVVQIPPGERLEGQWEFPVESITVEKTSDFKGVKPIKHSITRYRYEVYAHWSSSVPRELIRGRKTRYIDPENPDEIAILTTLSRKVLKQVFSS